MGLVGSSVCICKSICILVIFRSLVNIVIECRSTAHFFSMSVSDDRVYDIVVFGATGFTGSRVCEYLSQHNPSGYSWAAASRRFGSGNRWGVDSLEADASDSESLQCMTKLARVVLNCVGPYRFTGDAVIKACLSTGTHYLDVCGEPEALERAALNYHTQAEVTGVIIVGACGFDSIPADLGSYLLCSELSKSGAQPLTLESFLSIETGPKGAGANYATYESAIHGFAGAPVLRALRSRARKQSPTLPSYASPSIPLSPWPKFDQRVGRWRVVFPGADASVVKRSFDTQASLTSCPRPRYYAYYAVSSTLWMILGLFLGLVFQILVRSSLGRKILLRYPRLFTFGVFSRQGPSEAQIAGTSFTMQFFGTGQMDTGEHIGKQLSVAGPEPGYVATPICIVQACFVLLEERELLPAGGVLTPAVALGNSSFTDRLNKCGITFSSQ